MSEVANVNVPKLPLEFKPKNVRVFEEKSGTPITEMLDESVGKLNKLVSIGNGNCDEDTADGIIETFFDAGGDIIEGIAQVIEALQRGGFLPCDLAIVTIMRKQLKNQMSKLGQDLERGSEETSVE